LSCELIVQSCITRRRDINTSEILEGVVRGVLDLQRIELKGRNRDLTKVLDIDDIRIY
jgi:hypothetical protein